ncbi:MAG: hypothetical protein E5X53_38545, partial [Mesorhizobium sp.]|uniref:hypothetical protein n=1 Tax=Mesorhizobium sp. TaxID=1871066 RepID=UPI0011F99C09
HGPDMGFGVPAAAESAAGTVTDEAGEAVPATVKVEPKQGDTPSLLSALRLEDATASKIDASAYVSIRDPEVLKA